MEKGEVWVTWMRDDDSAPHILAESERFVSERETRYDHVVDW